MQYKDSLNYSLLISPEVLFDCKYRRLQQVKGNTLTVFCFVLILGLFLTAVFPCGVTAGHPGSEDESPPMVTVAIVSEEDVNPPAEYVGHVEAIQSVDLRARVEGFLEQVNFKEGSNVKIGRLLYCIEQKVYQAKVNACKAIMAQAEATLTKTCQYLKRAQAVRFGGVSATDMDNAIADELLARAQLEKTRADLTTAQINLDYTLITAPISGRIGRTTFTHGNLVNPASGPLARIVQLDPVRVIYSISENDFAVIQTTLYDAKKGKKSSALKLRLKLANGEVLKVTGKVDFVDNHVDPNTGTIAVRALFDNPDGTLLPGQYVTVMVTRSKPKLMSIVPQSAVLEDHDGRYVIIVDAQNRTSIRRIKMGPVIGINWAVESGVATGEKVIVQGIQKVQPGQIVKIVTSKKQSWR